MLTTCLGFNVAAQESEEPQAEIAESQSESAEVQTNEVLDESLEVLSEDEPALNTSEEQSPGKKPKEITFDFVYNGETLSYGSKFIIPEDNGIIQAAVVQNVFDYYYNNQETVNYDNYHEAVRNGNAHLIFEDDTVLDLPVYLMSYDDGFEFLGCSYSYTENNETYSFNIVVDELKFSSKTLNVTYESGGKTGSFKLLAQIRDYEIDGVKHPFDVYQILENNINYDNLNVTFNKAEGQESLELVEDNNILIPSDDNRGLIRFSGYRCEHDNRMSYFLIRDLPLNDLGVTLQSAGNTYTFEYSFKGKDGVDYYWISGELMGIDYNDLNASDKDGNVLRIVRDYQMDGGSFIVAVTEDGKSVFLITRNQKEAYILYGKNSIRYNFYFAGDTMDGSEYYELDHVNDFDINKVTKIVFEGKDIDLTDLTVVKFNDSTYTAKKVENIYFLFEKKTPEVTVIYTNEYEKEEVFHFKHSWEDEKYMAYQLDTGNYYPENIDIGNLSNVYFDGVESECNFNSTVEYNGVIFRGFKYKLDGFDKDVIFYFNCEPVNKVNAYLIYEENRYNFEYSMTDIISNTDIYHPASNMNNFDPEGQYEIHIADGEEEMVVTPKYDKETNSLCYKGYIQSIKRNVNLTVMSFDNQSDESNYDVVLNYEKSANEKYAFPFRYAYTDSEGNVMYDLDLSQLREMFKMEFVKNVVYKHGEDSETLPIERKVIDNRLQYVAVLRENEEVKAYFMIHDASVYEKAELELFGDTIPLTFNINNSNCTWGVFTEGYSADRISRINYLRDNFSAVDFEIKYYINKEDSEPALIQTASEAVYNNSNGIHGYKIFYTGDGVFDDVNYVESGSFNLSNNSNDVLPEYSSITSAYFEYDGVTYYFDINNPVIKGDSVTYNIINEGNVDFTPLINRYDIPKFITVEYKTTKGRSARTMVYFGKKYLSQYERMLGAAVYTTKNGNHDYLVKFKIMDLGMVLDNGSVVVVDGYKSQCDLEYNKGTYSTTIYVDPFVLNENDYVDVKVLNIAPEGQNLILESTKDSPEEVESTKKNIVFRIKKNQDNIIIFKTVDPVTGEYSGTTQNHNFRLDGSVEEALKYTFIESADIVAEKVSFNYNRMENADSARHTFASMYFNLLTQSTILYDEMFRAVENEDYAAASKVEEQILSLTFRSGVKVNREYEISGNVVNIIYTLSKDGQTQKIVFTLHLSGGYASEVKIDGNRCSSRVVYVENPNTGNVEEYYIYNAIGNNVYLTSQQILELTNYRYHQLYAGVHENYSDNNSQTANLDEMIYKDGVYYSLNREIVLDLFDVTNLNIEYTYGNSDTEYSLDGAVKANPDCGTIYTYFYTRDNNLNSAKNSINNMGPVTIKNAEGEFEEITLRFDTYEQLLDYKGTQPAYAASINYFKGENNPYEVTVSVKQAGVDNIGVFNRYVPGNTENMPDGGTVSVSDESELINAIKNLYQSNNSTIVLINDITLKSDLLINHPVGNLYINLNGHSITTANNSIKIIDNTKVNFYNSSEIDSVINSTGDGVFITNLGNLSINQPIGSYTANYGKVYVNCEGTAISSASSTRTEIYDNVEINAAICLKYAVTNENLTWFQMDVRYRGTKKPKLNAGYAAIYAEGISGLNNTSQTLQIEGEIVSKNIGVYVTGDVNVSALNSKIDAKSPFIIGGADLSINSTNITCSDITYSATYKYNKTFGDPEFTTNGAVILVDSANSNVSNASVSIDTTYCKITGAGPLIAETRKGNTGKITAVEITNGSYYPFEMVGNVPAFNYKDGDGRYEDRTVEFAGELIDIIDSTKVNFGGGVYKYDISSFDYVDTDVTPVYEVTVMYNGLPAGIANLYYAKPQNNSATVNSYSTLKEALENKGITYIVADSSIIYDSNTDESNVLKVNVGRSGKFINVINDSKIEGYKFAMNGLADGNSGYYRVTINNANLINNNDSVLTVDGCYLNLESSSVSSGLHDAIVVNSGNLYISKSNVSGTTAVKANVTGQAYADITVNGSTLSGTNGPALDLNNETDRSVYIHLQRHWGDQNTYSVISSQKDVAVKTSGRVDISVYGANISGARGLELTNADSSHVYIDNNNAITANAGEAVVIDNSATNGTQDSYINIYGAELKATADTLKLTGRVYYYVSGVKFKKGNGNLFVNSTSSNGNVESGYFNGMITSKELGYLANDTRYEYKTIETNTLEEYPYSLVKSERTSETNKGVSYANIVLGNSRTVEVKTNNAISPAEAYAYKEQNNGKELEMVLNVAEKESTFAEELGVKESFDISVTKDGNETTELVNYQTVTMSVSDYKKMNSEGVEENVYSNPENLIVYHNHDGNTYALKKVSPEDGKLLKEECYYITYDEKNVAYVNIVTRQFSEFGLAEADVEIPVSELKNSAQLQLNYEDTYTLSDLKQPAYAEVNGYKLLSGDATIVYEGINGTVFYSENELPTIGGNFKVTWYAKDNNSLGISGSGSTVISIVNNESSNIADYECEVYGNSISLDGDIAKNFYIVIDSSLLLDEGAYAELSDGKYAIRQNVREYSDAVNIDGNSVTMGKFTYRVAAKEIYKPITVRLYTGDGKLVKLSHTVNGYTKDVTAGYTSSVGEYLNAMLESENVKPELYNVCSRMVEYGELAANYFDGERAEISDDVLNVAARDLEQYKAVEASSEYVTEHAVSLVLESETTIKHYFRFGLGEYENFNISVNGKAVTVEQRSDDTGTYYVLSIPNIAAKNLDKTYVVELKHSSGEVLRYEYSALSYVYAQLNNNRDGLLRDLCASIYLYNLAADQYFDSVQG